eukprot:198714-Chlamydomonas_euryale.AAC.1
MCGGRQAAAGRVHAAVQVFRMRCAFRGASRLDCFACSSELSRALCAPCCLDAHGCPRTRSEMLSTRSSVPILKRHCNATFRSLICWLLPKDSTIRPVYDMNPDADSPSPVRSLAVAAGGSSVR